MKPKEEKDESQIHVPKESITKGEHEFDYISGTEVMCKRCPLGYVVGADTEIKEGHIYIKDVLVI